MQNSVHCSEADVTACDNSDLNPFMLALKMGHKVVAQVILEEDASCLGSGGKIVDWALEEKLTLFFQVLYLYTVTSQASRIFFQQGRLDGCSCDTRWLWFYSQLIGEVSPDVLVTPLTGAGNNTIVHLIAAAENTEMFKVKVYVPD